MVNIEKQMRFIIIVMLWIVYSHSVNGQQMDSGQLIELGKYYSNYMFMTDPPKSVEEEFGLGFGNELATAVAFIKEAATTKNKLLTPKYLNLPDSLTLKAVFIVDALHQNPHRKRMQEPRKLVDSLLAAQIPMHELVDEYYSTMFTAVGNKNKPFNLAKVDFRMKDYGLDSDILKGIFFLRCMEQCGSQIFGYMNIVKPPNTQKALQYINKFPKFDGSAYFRYTDLYFEDFEMEIINDKGLQSYKDYYVDKLYSTLLSHLLCMNRESYGQDKINELLLGSILKDNTLYKHTGHKETLEGIFKKQ